MKKEIGSEFWKATPRKGQKEYFLSGRTALEFIIRDILEEQKVTSVLLPSYCCHTMIEPFFRHGIQVRFYDVFFDEKRGLCVDIPAYQDNEIFYSMTYFGYQKLYGADPIAIRRQYRIIINDSTHSWLSGEDALNADYSFTSFRKWNGFSGIAEANKKNGWFKILPNDLYNEKYISLRETAFSLKKTFIDTGEGDKNIFLEIFDEAENLLEKDYLEYRPSYRAIVDFLNTDWEEIKKLRRENAKYLMDGLKDCDHISLIYDQLEEDEVPLFVPILVKKDRDSLRQYLIAHQVYCPVHWPLSDFHNGISMRAMEIYNRELSLLCDQRYDREDMERIVALVREFYG